MNSSKPSSAPATAKTRESAPKSEAAYLKAQAANAKLAFKQTLGEAGSDLGHGASPAAWTEEHPWVMLSSAAVAGFVAAAVAIPSKEQAAKRKLAELERLINPHASDNRHESNGHHKPAGKGLLGFVITQLIQGASAVIAGVLQAKKQTTDQAEADKTDPPSDPAVTA